MEVGIVKSYQSEQTKKAFKIAGVYIAELTVHIVYTNPSIYSKNSKYPKFFPENLLFWKPISGHLCILFSSIRTSILTRKKRSHELCLIDGVSVFRPCGDNNWSTSDLCIQDGAIIKGACFCVVPKPNSSFVTIKKFCCLMFKFFL